METEDQLQQKEQEKQKVSRYIVAYRGVSQGLQKLYIPGSDGESRNILHVLCIREYGHSQYPFTMTLYCDPTQLAHPVREVNGLNSPYGIAVNSRGEMIVSDHWGHQIAIFDIRGQRIQTFGSHGDSPEQMICPKGISIDDMDNIYVSSRHKLQKFTHSGELIRCVGSQEGEFDDPRGVTLHNNQVYVCDGYNYRIQVFDLDLNFIRSIVGMEPQDFTLPKDVKFDRDGNMYIIDQLERVQVLDRNGHFIRVFGICIHAIHILDKYVYAAFYSRIQVYETSGQFVTSFAIGYHGERAKCISSSPDGFIYVSYWPTNIIRIF